ncbi:MAG: hypothetical protein A4E67_00105 [Syntrophaceae bacterium PtaB.Bin038]|nr:MAG: hypothetical protein A4E67_00105 [Syntrophaceae bacterium PtaB.Bin038]
MKRGSSASIHSGAQSAEALAIASSYQMSLGPMVVLILSPTRFTTMTFSTEGLSLTASSALDFWGTAFAPRKVPSQVTRIFEVLSWRRSRRASELNPPNTTLWIAPMRVQASRPIASSGIMGR